MSAFRYLRHAGGVLREATRHLLRRPIVGVAAVAHTQDGRLLLIRRGDTGGWALPGGTLEWGETLRTSLARELDEEAGATLTGVRRVTGVYSRPDRDWRFHGVSVVVAVEIDSSLRGPKNLVEIREARLFCSDEVPARLDFGGEEMLQHAKDPHASAYFE